MNPELVELCGRKYGARWWLGLAREISLLSGSPLRPVQRTTLRWAAGQAEPTPAAAAAIKLLASSPPFDNPG